METKFKGQAVTGLRGAAEPGGGNSMLRDSVGTGETGLGTMWSRREWPREHMGAGETGLGIMLEQEETDCSKLKAWWSSLMVGPY